MRRYIYRSTLIGILIVLGLTACKNNKDQNKDIATVLTSKPTQAEEAGNQEEVSDTDVGTDAITAQPTLEPVKDDLTEAIFMDKDADYRKMIEASLISTGNNYRMKKAIEKAQNGEKVTIAYIGGSITEGAAATSKEKNYAYLSYKYFKDTFGKDGGDNVKFVNAGMGGTPSTLGVIRYDRDVTSYGEVLPDIVYIEFSVNDYQEPTNGAAFESMVRNIMNAPNQPAVVLLFCVFKSRWNMQDNYLPIGYYYELPMISIKDAVVPELEAGRITDDQFFADIYHPTDFGHGLMTDCIKYYYTTVNAETEADENVQIPAAARISKAFEGIKMYDSATEDDNVKVEAGGFNGNDSALVRFATGNPSFPNNWKHAQTGGDQAFKMTLNCKNLLFVYKSSGSYGTAEVYVDGKLSQTLDSTQGGGWNNPMTVLLINDTTPADHIIEVKMAQGHENKEFTIMAVGYTQ
jgi:hypothetical protein